MASIMGDPIQVIVFAVIFFVMYLWAAHKVRTTGKPHYRFMKGILAACIICLAMAAIAGGRG